MTHAREEGEFHVHQFFLVLGLLVHPFHSGGEFPATKYQTQEPENDSNKQGNIQDQRPGAAIPRRPHDECKRLDVRRPDMLVIAGPHP